MSALMLENYTNYTKSDNSALSGGSAGTLATMELGNPRIERSGSLTPKSEGKSRSTACRRLPGHLSPNAQLHSENHKASRHKRVTEKEHATGSISHNQKRLQS